MSILVTGGCGYIGSHTVVELLNNNKEVVIVDDYSNSKPEVLNRIETITGKRPRFYHVNILDEEKLSEVFEKESIDSVIHFAAFKAVGESVNKPLDYYQNNLQGLLTVLKVMSKFNVKIIVFSSSATVYGMHNQSPLKEDLPTSATNPYGYTKLMNEQILLDCGHADHRMSVALPGISTSYLLLVLGLYEPTLNAIKTLNIRYLTPMLGGVFIGILLTTRFLNWLLKKHQIPTYLMIIGFMIGSIPQIFPGLPSNQGQLFRSILLLIVGILMMMLLDYLSQKEDVTED